jgi:hypothetical protein
MPIIGLFFIIVLIIQLILNPYSISVPFIPSCGSNDAKCMVEEVIYHAHNLENGFHNVCHLKFKNAPQPFKRRESRQLRILNQHNTHNW